MPIIEFDAPSNEGFQPLPEGTYWLRIESVEQGTSSAGNPQLVVKTKVVDGEYANKSVTIWYSLTPKSTWKLKALLDATDVPYEEVGGRVRFDTDDLYDREFVVDASVGVNPNTQKPKNDWSNERPPKGASKPQSAAAAASAPAPAQAAPAAAAAAPSETFRRRSRV
jgi:hypothetical protein